MKKLLYLFCLLPLLTFGQTETHDFVRLDTTIGYFIPPFGPTLTWIVEIEYPRNYFTVGNADTASRPAIIFMPGQGQQGSNASYANLAAYGPAYWRRNGWDGSVTLGNGVHYPILISIAYANNVTPSADLYYQVVDSIITKWHILPRGRHFTGFSQGAFTTGEMIKFEKTALAETGMSIVTSFAALEGTPGQLPSPYNGWDRDTVAYKVWAKKYGGKYFYLEGNGSDNFRDGWHYSVAMNDTVPGSGYFSYESLGGGAHCCWNSMYDPSATNWNCVTPPALGPNNAPSQVGKNTMGTYRIGQNIFTWMIAQGDTTLVGGGGGGGGQIAVNAGLDTTLTLPTNSMTLRGSATPPSGKTISSTLWAKVSGPGVTIGTPSSLNTTISGMTAGVYIFSLRAIDNAADTAYDSVQVTVLTNACRTFTWDSTNGNINLTNATLGAVPAVHRCDTIDIWDKFTNGGYRSISITNLGIQNDPNPGWIVIRGRGHNGSQGARLSPTTNVLFADLWDNNNWIHLDSFYTYDRPDPFLNQYIVNGYSHHMWFTHMGLRGQGSFFPSSTISHSLPNWTGPFGYNGGPDTVNCLYDWTLESSRLDSSYGNNSGMTAYWIGGANKNNVCLKWSVKNTSFDHYSSSGNPACYISAINVYGLYLDNDSISNLGVSAKVVGHASSVFLRNVYSKISNTHFGPGILGDDVRSSGQGDIPGMEAFFKAIDTSYDGRSQFFNIITEHKRKYPVYETRNNPTDTAMNSFYRGRVAPRMAFITAYKLAIGAEGPGSVYYNASVVDGYTPGTDSIYLKNVVFAAIDSAAAWGQHTTASTVAMCTFPAGNPGYADTTNLWFQPTFALSGLADTVKYYPVSKGPLFRTGIGLPYFPPFDFYHVSRATVGPVDIGAVILFSLGCDCLAPSIPIKFN